MHKIENEAAAPECPSGHDGVAASEVEVTSEMIWAALEEWSGFDEARNELEPLFERIYRAMACAQRNTGINRATIARAD